MAFDRASGILLHPTSLPSVGGIGDLGPAAYEFVDFLSRAKQRLWQVLPLNPPGLGNSPYSAISAFAGNPLLISLELLAKYGWIQQAELQALPEAAEKVDFAGVNQRKLPLLRKAAANFLRRAPDALGEHERFRRFCGDSAWWLEDYVVFAVLREHFGGESWNKWPREIARREPQAMEKLHRAHAERLDVERALQFAFFEQWGALHKACRERGIRIVGDVAIFVNFDSADVWTHPELFYLDDELAPTVVSGVPPDAFSETGQRWGNPLYRWDVLKQRGYDWWKQRMGMALNVCDYVRLDHFRGFQQFWEIPASEPTAVKGKWVDGPKADLFEALREQFGELPFIAEDLGLITEDVVALREQLGVPGMKVMQFGFSDPGAHIYLPHRYEANCVAYTGTHDNDTTLGWWAEQPESERAKVLAYLGDCKDGVHWAMVRAIEASVAEFCIIPLQDVLGLDGTARMNRPSNSGGNWGWRYSPGALKVEIAEKLAAVTEIADRAPAA
jgi:4-alpha-glucanotransferase